VAADGGGSRSAARALYGWVRRGRLDAALETRRTDGGVASVDAGRDAEHARPTPCPVKPKRSDLDLALRYRGRMSRELRVEGSVIWAQSRARLQAPADVVRDLLLGDWNRWFRNSKSMVLDPTDPRFTAGADSVRMFNPMGFTTMVTMRVTIWAPVPESRTHGGDAWRIRTTLDGDAVGETDYEIESTAPSGRTSDRGCVLRATWHGVRNVGRAPTWSVAWGHSLGEVGKLPFPLATGFPGLIDLAENGNCSCRGRVCS
jgi:hypothetical protein